MSWFDSFGAETFASWCLEIGRISLKLRSISVAWYIKLWWWLHFLCDLCTLPTMYRHPIRFSIHQTERKKEKKGPGCTQSRKFIDFDGKSCRSLFADCHRFQNGVGPHIFKGRVHFDSDCERHTRRKDREGNRRDIFKPSYHAARQREQSRRDFRARRSERSFFFSKWNSIDL